MNGNNKQPHRTIEYSRRRVLQASSLVSFLLGAPAWARGKPKRPNIVLIVADDMRYDSMGFIDRNVITPHFDAFATEAVRFRNAFVTTSVCSTSRASIFTGAYASRHGVWDFETDLNPRMRSISYPVILKALGYRNAFFGKYGLCDYTKATNLWGGTISSREPEFDVFDTSDTSVEAAVVPWRAMRDSTRSVSQKAIEFINNQETGQPFSLSVSFLAPHANDLGADPITGEYSPEPDMLEKYESLADVPPRPAELVEPAPHLGIEKHARTLWQRRFSEPELRLDSLKKYWAMISGVDRAFGEICDALRQQGVYDDTLVIFMSDNGYLMGDYKMDGKSIANESSIRIPLLIKPPQQKVGMDRADNVLNIDICPTIIALASRMPANGYQGFDLSPTWSGGKIDRNEFLYEWGPNADSGIRALRNRRYTYVEYSEGEKRGTYLYDRDEDPYELRDISAETGQERLQAFHEDLHVQLARYQ